MLHLTVCFSLKGGGGGRHRQITRTVFSMQYNEVYIFKKLKICDRQSWLWWTSCESRRFLHPGQTLWLYGWMYSQVVSSLWGQAHQLSPSAMFLGSAASLVISFWRKNTLHENGFIIGVCVRIRERLTCMRLKFSGNRLVRRLKMLAFLLYAPIWLQKEKNVQDWKAV